MIYEQDSFEPVAQLIWLRDGLIAANDEPTAEERRDKEGWYGNNKSIFGTKSIGTGSAVFYENSTTPNPLSFNGVFTVGSIAGAFGQSAAGPIAMGENLGDTSGLGLSSDVLATEMGKGTAIVSLI